MFHLANSALSGSLSDEQGWSSWNEIWVVENHIELGNVPWKELTPVWRAWLERSIAREMISGDHAWGPQAANIWKMWSRFVWRAVDFTTNIVTIFSSQWKTTNIILTNDITKMISIKEVTARWVKGWSTWRASANCWLVLKGVGHPEGDLCK